MKRRKQKGIARWTCADGRDHTGRAPTQREADIISANMSGRPCFGHSGRGRRVKRQKPVSLTFASVAQEWLAYYPTLGRVRESSMRGYRSFVECHLVPALGHLPVSAITADTVEAFIATKRQGEGKLKDSSLRTGLLALRLILKRAVRRRLIPANPMAEVEWKGAERRENVDPFTAHELRAIFAAADEINWNFGTMLRLWAGCGARAGEVSALQWQDIDLKKGTVFIRRQFSHHRLLPWTKTGRERVSSFLHPVSVDGDWRPADTGLLDRLTKVQSTDPEAFLFGGSKPLSSMEVHRLWRRTLAKAQVRYRSPEQLRHTFASMLLSRNAPLVYVQRQGGWKSAVVLLQSYARWVGEADAHETANDVALKQAARV